MIEYDCPQGEDEWVRLRLGIPTASAFARILTPAKLKPSTQVEPFINELLAEWRTGEPCADIGSPWFTRGHELEAEARSWYEFTNDVVVRQIGFVMNDEGTVGCSPDGLVGDDGGIEVKCYGAAKHMGILRGGGIPADALMQIHGNLWITERVWWDAVFYNPVLGNEVIRVERDEEYIKVLAEAVGAFVDRLAEAKQDYQNNHGSPR